MVEYPAVPAAAQMLDHALSIAAIGFMVFVLMFVHPASQANRAAALQAAAAGETAVAGATPVAGANPAAMRPRLAASK
jgi:hypothetical protein